MRISWEILSVPKNYFELREVELQKVNCMLFIKLGLKLLTVLKISVSKFLSLFISRRYFYPLLVVFGNRWYYY